MKNFTRRALLALAALLPLGSYAQEKKDDALIVFAASSLSNVLQEIGDAYTRNGGPPVKLSFAASSVLARQVEAGAQADVFFSADIDWVDYLQSHDLIQPATRTNIVGNRLVLIAPKSSSIQLKIVPGFKLAAALGSAGRLATGEVSSVPVGRYAKAAFTKLGVWDAIETRVVGAENVRAAMAYVDRGEAALGVVYESDALVDRQVRVVDVFPADSHPPIVYPAAVTKTAKPGAQSFVKFLSGDAAQSLFKKYGFTPIK